MKSYLALAFLAATLTCRFAGAQTIPNPPQPPVTPSFESISCESERADKEDSWNYDHGLALAKKMAARMKQPTKIVELNGDEHVLITKGHIVVVGRTHQPQATIEVKESKPQKPFSELLTIVTPGFKIDYRGGTTAYGGTGRFIPQGTGPGGTMDPNPLPGTGSVTVTLPKPLPGPFTSLPYGEDPHTFRAFVVLSAKDLHTDGAYKPTVFYRIASRPSIPISYGPPVFQVESNASYHNPPGHSGRKQ